MINETTKELYLKEKEEQVNINDLISIANYYIEVSKVPPYDVIEEEFSDTWADIYLDEDLKNHEGENCFIVYDNCANNIRAIVVGDSLTDIIKMQLIDIMDNVIFDLLYFDTIEQIEIETGKCQELDELYNNQDYSKLLTYIKNHVSLLEDVISSYRYSWLLVLAEGRFDLVTLA